MTWLRSPVQLATDHLDATRQAIDSLAREAPTLLGWGAELWDRCCEGHRLLVAGNGGSAAQAQHLAAELVGRYRGERRPLSALAIGVDPAATSAIANDYGVEDQFARQIEAHGRLGDVALFLSTSGSSPNVVAAALAARRAGLRTWALTGPLPNRLAEVVDEVVAVSAARTASVQEAHQVAIHLVCEALEDRRSA
jgi:D-sedoheptulose 7-phosphate isomerase